jgi:hypothetical protein
LKDEMTIIFNSTTNFARGFTTYWTRCAQMAHRSRRKRMNIAQPQIRLVWGRSSVRWPKGTTREQLLHDGVIPVGFLHTER